MKTVASKRLHPQGVKTFIYDTVDHQNRFNNGELEFEFTTDDQYWQKQKAVFPLISVWVDPANSSVFKAYGQIEHQAVDQLSKAFAADVYSEFRGLTFSASSIRRHISVSQGMKIIRYAPEDRTFLSTNNETGQRTPVFNSKTDAMKSILEVVQSYGKAKVSGLDLIDLNRIKDSVLIEMGFQEIPDLLGWSPSMWMGDAESAITLGAKSSRYSWGGHKYGKDDEEDGAATYEEVAKSFLNILEAELV